jgi:hypothetical protein
MVNKNERIISLPARSARAIHTANQNRFPDDDLWNLCVHLCHLVDIIGGIHAFLFIHAKTQA